MYWAAGVILSYLPVEGIIGQDTNVNCKAPGNPKCNPESWVKYGGYSNACCSEEEKCTINEGDCNLDAECYGSLVCKPNSCPISKDDSKKFHERASCCQQPSGSYILGKKWLSLLILYIKSLQVKHF